ncbi:MAG: hypothetical protein K6G91_09805 [Kiritimatiellae bacterium]|nr:hypothetical protein [Kiritimatiellia bacterium]
MISVLLFAVLVSGADLIEGDFDGKTIEVEGRAMGFTESGFAMKVDDIPLTVITQDRPWFLRACSVTQPKLHVRGVLEQVYGSTASGQMEGIVGLRMSPTEGMSFVPDARFFFNPFTLTLLVAVLVAYMLYASHRQLKTKTLMAERKRMADDLHDTIEQHLVGAGMLLQLGKNGEAREILVRAKKEMRDIVWGLKNDDMMRLTPSEMIREYARGETKKGICRIEARLSGLPERMDASQMRDLSLVVREAVGNAVKHGGAHKVAIVSDPLEGGGWQLRVANDGIPFDPGSAPGPGEGHFGLEGMKARALRLGAKFTIDAPDGRTVVTLVKPGKATA